MPFRILHFSGFTVFLEFQDFQIRRISVFATDSWFLDFAFFPDVVVWQVFKIVRFPRFLILRFSLDFVFCVIWLWAGKPGIEISGNGGCHCFSDCGDCWLLVQGQLFAILIVAAFGNFRVSCPSSGTTCIRARETRRRRGYNGAVKAWEQHAQIIFNHIWKPGGQLGADKAWEQHAQIIFNHIWPHGDKLVQSKRGRTMPKSYLIIFADMVQSKHERNMPKSYLIIFEKLVWQAAYPHTQKSKLQDFKTGSCCWKAHVAGSVTFFSGPGSLMLNGNLVCIDVEHTSILSWLKGLCDITHFAALLCRGYI